jgi:RNA polymerase sigma factor (sigma-70 family)
VHTDRQPADDEGGSLRLPDKEPENLEDWIVFHSQVKKLPAELFEIFDLLFYNGLTQEEAARVLGVSLRTVKRRWQTAQLTLHRELSRERTG